MGDPDYPGMPPNNMHVKQRPAVIVAVVVVVAAAAAAAASVMLIVGSACQHLSICNTD